MKVIIEVEKFKGTTIYEFDPMSVQGYIAEAEMQPLERVLISTALRGLADLIDPEVSGNGVRDGAEWGAR